jgi:phosphoglycerate dehydrogenase-like enzyme
VPEATALRTGGAWQHTLGTDLHGRTLGSLGFGRMSQVAAIGRAFGMDVLAWSQNLTRSTRTVTMLMPSVTPCPTPAGPC